MSIEKKTVVDQIEVVANGCVQVRTATIYIENDVQVSKSFSRHVVAPGDDYAGEDDRVQAICAAAHTAAVIAAYQAAQAAQGV